MMGCVRHAETCLRRESFQNGTPRFGTLIMGDLSIDEGYSDEELTRKLGHSATVHDMKHHKLGGLKNIVMESKCLFLLTSCQLLYATLRD